MHIRNVLNSNGHEYPFTNAGVQAAIDDLVNGGVVWLPQGECLITNTLVTPYPSLTIQGVGHGVVITEGVTRLKLADNADVDVMYVNERNICLRDFYIHGNRDNNVAGRGLFYSSTDGSIENIGVLQCSNHALECRSHSALLKNVYLEDSDVHAMFARGMTFTTLINVWYWGCVQNGLLAEVCYDNVFVHSIVHGNYRHGFQLKGCHNNRFIGDQFYNNGQLTNNTYDNIRMEIGDATNCVGNIFVAPRMWSEVANKPRYGIREADANQDYNEILGGSIENCITSPMSLQGVHSFHKDVLYVNPLAASTPAVGASPVTFGPYHYPTRIEIVGDVTSVTVRGQISAMPANANFIGCWLLYPGDTCVIVYPGVAPTVTLWPQ